MWLNVVVIILAMFAIWCAVLVLAAAYASAQSRKYEDGVPGDRERVVPPGTPRSK